MSNLTPQEIQLLETRQHRTQLWLSIYQPDTVLACQVSDGSIARKARSIAYDSVTDGSYTFVEGGMVMLIGTDTGKADKGRIRVRSATSGTISVAENSHVDWADDDYLTIINFYEVTAIYPRIIHDPADDLDVIFYKNYDVAYTNQNTVLGSFPVMGPHRAGFVDPASGLLDIYYTASGTSHVKGEELSYAWWFQGATTTGSFDCTPGDITYDTPGHYTTRLYISGSSSIDYSYRHVSVYDRPGSGDSTPILNWELLSLSGSRDDGSYRAEIRVRDIVNVNTIRDGSLVVIFSDDWYGNTKQSVGGNAQNASSIVFTGYILDGSIEYDYQDGYIEFEVGSSTEVMKNKVGFAISVESKVTPATWFELQNMNCKRALYHYLRWHTTALLCNDYEFSADDQNIQFFDSDRESMYDAIRKFMENTLVGSVVSDMQGKTWFEVEAKGINNAATSIVASPFHLDKSRWMGVPLIDERQQPRISFIEMGGIQYDGPATGNFQALLSMAPGDAPGYGGGISRKRGLALTSQNQLNILSGNVYAWENSRYPNVQLNLIGNFRNFDIAPNEIVYLTVGEYDTPRRISFSNKEFTVQRLYWSYLSDSQVMLLNIELSEVTQGIIGETLIIPDAPPTDGFNIPPFEFPPIGGIFGPFTSFLLYDEGVLLGKINSLDAVGSSVVATTTGTAGTLTFSCATECGTSTAVYFSTSTAVTSLTSGDETLLSISAYDKSGYTIPAAPADFKLVFDFGGVHNIQLNDKTVYTAFLPGDTSIYYGKRIIKHYDAGDNLLATWEENGEPMKADTPPVATAYVSMGVVLEVSAGDYITISGQLTNGDNIGSTVAQAQPNQITVFKI